MERLREELEREREEDRAKHLLEIEAIRQQNNYTPTSDCQEDLDNDPRQNGTYDLLQSIAQIPIQNGSPDISERVVVGKEKEELLCSPRYCASPEIAHSYKSFSACSATPDSSPEGVIRRTSITQEQINDDTIDISIVDKEEKQLFRLDSRTEKGNGYCVVSHVEEEEQENGGDAE